MSFNFFMEILNPLGSSIIMVGRVGKSPITIIDKNVGEVQILNV